ncbi:hypothetical protein ABPG72_002693 [Tetrahymena utriculariae]
MNTQIESFIERQKKNTIPQMFQTNQRYQYNQADINKSNPLSYLKLWNQPKVKEQLKQSIQEKIQQGIIPNNKIINEKMLITEYWCQWLDINQTDFLQLIQKNPRLTVQDHQDIQSLVLDENARMGNWVLGMSIFTYGVYFLGFKKHAMFYNRFQKKSPYKIVRYSKNVLGCLLVMSTWSIMLKFFFEQAIPNQLSKKEYLNKYHILKEEVYL